MPTTHTVTQGETLTRIAKQYGFSSWQKIYNHSDNTEFRALRSNPDIIYPGDTIVIPDPEQKPRRFKTNKPRTFRLSIPKEELTLKLQDDLGKPLTNIRAALNIGGKTIQKNTDSNGELLILLDNSNESEASLEIEDNGTKYSFKLKIGELDPIDTISGVQARCNALGFDCGTIDGIYGKKTKEGLLSFQRVYALSLTGEADAATQKALTKAYGC